LGASLSYAFDVPVSDDIVEGTGGRRLGTLIGTVVADGRPVAGVVVSVGRFRVMTDEAGRFELRLAPGSYQVEVDRGAEPEGYRVVDPAQVNVEVGVRSVHEVHIILERAAP
jgi:hypothetical protein